MQLGTGPTVSKAIEVAQVNQVGLMLCLAPGILWGNKGACRLYSAVRVTADCRVRNGDGKLDFNSVLQECV